MCLIIHKKAGQALTEHEIEHVWLRNQDGWGLMYVDDGKAVAQCGLTVDGCIDALKPLDDREAFVHFRLATHGEKDTRNCHPYEVLPGLYFMHNGIINISCAEDPSMSDSWHFAQLVLKPMLEIMPEKDRAAYIRSEAFQYILQTSVESSNRIVLFDSEGGVIFNRQSWHFIRERDMLVSNMYAFDKPAFLKNAVETMPHFRGHVHETVDYNIDNKPCFTVEDEPSADPDDETPPDKGSPSEEILEWLLCYATRPEAVEYIHEHPGVIFDALILMDYVEPY